MPFRHVSGLSNWFVYSFLCKNFEGEPFLPAVGASMARDGPVETFKPRRSQVGPEQNQAGGQNYF